MNLLGLPRQVTVGIAISTLIIGAGASAWATTASPSTSANSSVAAPSSGPEMRTIGDVATIFVADRPSRTSYVIGSVFQPAGLRISAASGAGAASDLAAGEYTLAGFDSNTPGSKNVQVIYTANPQITTSFKVTVEDVTLPSSNLLENASFESGAATPWDVVYAEGSGANVSGSNSNGISADNGQDGNAGFSFWDRNVLTQAKVTQTLKDLPRGYYTATGYGAGDTGAGEALLTVTGQELDLTHSFALTGGGKWDKGVKGFQWAGGDLKVGFSIAMSKAGGWAAFDNFSLVRSAEAANITRIMASSNKTELILGEDLDASALSVRKVMADGTTFALQDDEWTMNGFDKTVLGTQTVTVVLTAVPSKTASFEVTVGERAPQDTDIASMKVAAEPLRTLYKQGRDFSREGLAITGETRAGETRILQANEFSVTGFDPNRLGTQTVTAVLATDASVTATVTVTVVAQAAAGTYEITNLGANSTDGVITIANGASSVDLSKVPAGNGTVVIKRGAMTSALTGLSFTRASGDVLDLVVEDWALAQQGTPTLKTVAFPEGLDTLSIGDSAFFQYTANGSATLAEVLFPRELWSLNIGENAFSQDVRDGATLQTVTFSQNAHSLVIGAQAFRQKYGISGALESVNLPPNLETLEIGSKAFSVNPSYKAGEPLRSVYLDFKSGGAPTGTVFLGKGLTDTGSPLHPASATWLWQGAESTLQGVFGTSVDAGMKPTPVKHGYGLRFEPNTGNSATLATNLPPNTGFVPMGGAPAVWEQSIPSTVPTRSGFTFTGWRVDTTGKTLLAPGSRVTLADLAQDSLTLFAQWEETDNGNNGTVTDPATTAPATTVPATTAPATTVPATTAPATTVPATAIELATDSSSKPSENGGDLAQTGFKAGGVLLLALLAIAGGILLNRRRSRQSH